MGDVRKDISDIKRLLCCNSSATPDPCCPETNIILNDILLELQKKKYDFEILCASTDNRLIVSKFDKELGTSVLTELDGTPVLDGATGVKCTNLAFDKEQQLVCVNGVQWVKTYIYDVSLNIPELVSVFFIDENDVIQPQPTDYTYGTCEAIQYPKVVNGELLTLVPGGTDFTDFNANEVSDIMVTNLTNGIISILYTTLFAATGNKIFYCASGQTVHINTNDSSDLISRIDINDISNVGGGSVIVNATRI